MSAALDSVRSVGVGSASHCGGGHDRGRRCSGFCSIGRRGLSQPLIPFAIEAMTMIQLLFLHQTGSNKPLGLNNGTDKIPFHPYFTARDIVGFTIIIIVLSTLTLREPYILGDQDNFTPANPLVIPVHIQPE